ncbi:NUDIX domain-containing protein [Bifidobacterium biavatii]|uniref:ADP-ribose pyrophosphatase n=1 Tax=Bifidobacterium biavatii DSM 23969 TaxID=1437608 RepID=A0A086ZUI1_9BIFI|nr:NUDIX hydrolase [Bifidobacterium biavatii]KFI50181.1 ADP-ribose pyrophosphatase [Bifidobacterium biavatii DSM 23969]
MSNETYRRFDPWRTSPLKEESRKQIVKSHYFNVDQVSLSSPQAGTFERYVLQGNNGDAVGVLAMTDDGLIPLVEQYRIPTHRWTLEIPGGHAAEQGEKPLDIAVRKLREEAGYTADHLVQFARFIDTPSFSAQHTALFFATGLHPADRSDFGPETPRPDVRLYTLDQAYEMAVNGTIVDAKTLIAILRLHSAPDHQLDQ